VSSPWQARIAPAPRVRGTLLRIALIGTLSALLVLAAGWAIRRTVIGVDNDQARARVQAEVRGAFAALSAGLRDMTARLADPAAVRAAADGDTTAARDLAERADEVTAAAEPDTSLTVYGADGTPIAWTGRPTEMRGDRLTGGETWFIAPGTLGLRLMYVRPVADGPTRVGTIVVERPLPASGEAVRRSGLQGTDTDAYRFNTSIAPVSIQLPFERIDRASRGTFDVATPSGTPLLIASVADEDLTATRDRWARATRSLSFIVLAITIVIMTAPILDWRNRLRDAGTYAHPRRAAI
jgi:hypothetical protein